MKKKLAATLSVVLILGLAVLGILAYLSDTDSDVNVMTLGNVDIEQIEQQEKEDGTLEPFEQAKGLYPGTEISKIVSVKNIGESDCYVRTLVAFEVIDSATFDYSFKTAGNSDWKISDKVGQIEKDGVNYEVYEFVYTKALAKDETTPASLVAVSLDPKCTNSDMTALGGTYEVLVLSQATQTEGFTLASGGTYCATTEGTADKSSAEVALDTAFGVVDAANLEMVAGWFEATEIPTLVSTVTELDELLEEGGNVVLTEDLSFSSKDTTANSGYGATGVSVKGGTLDGAGNSLGINNWGTWDAAVHTTGGTIKNLTINSGMRGIFMGSATDDVYIENVIIDGTVYTFNSDGGNKNYGVYISNSTLNGWTSHSDVHKEVVYTKCNFGEGEGYAFCRPYGPTKFVNCVFEEGYEFDTSKTSEIVFENCYYGDTLITETNAESLETGNVVFFYKGLNGITIK